MARAEVMWLMRHSVQSKTLVMPQKQKCKNFNEAGHDDINVVELIHWVVTLVNLVNEHKDIIVEYYLKYLKGTDLNKLRQEIDNFQVRCRGQVCVVALCGRLKDNVTVMFVAQAECGIDDAPLAVLRDIEDVLANLSAGDVSRLPSVRMNWQRLQVRWRLSLL